MLTKIRIKNYIFPIFFSLIIFLTNSSITYASTDFNIKTSFDIYLENINDHLTRVSETLEIEAITPEYFIPKNSQQKILTKKDPIIKDSLKITNKFGQNKIYEISETEENFEIIIQNRYDITKDRPFYAKVEYKTEELVNQNGNITNLYLPGLHKDTVFQTTEQNHNLKTTYQYNLSYHVPLDSPQASYITPSSVIVNETTNYRIYSISQEERLGTTGWIQLGQEQYYFFKITQEIPRTNFLTPESLSKHTKWLSTNILELAIPKEFSENNQEVYIKNIKPTPTRIRVDDEGNFIGIFEIDASKEKEVVIEGYIKLSQNIREIPDFSVSEYREKIQSLNNLDIYIQPDKYWESDHKEIQTISNSIFSEKGQSSILDIIKGTYYFVIDSLEYSTQKAEGENIRFGALKALQGAESVCMEYSDLMIAILRAQGIPSRAAFGYGNDPLITNTDREIAHQWVQVWIPEYGWLSIDPTWGETGREYIGADLDHLLWYTIGDSKQKVTDFAIYSADFIDPYELGFYEVKIEPLHESQVSNLETLYTISDIALEYSTSDNQDLQEIEYILKTTIPGRVIIFLIPIAIVVISTIILSIIISKIIKPKHRKTVYSHHKRP